MSSSRKQKRHRKPELTWERCRPHPANLSPSQAGESCSSMPEYVNRIYFPRPTNSTKSCSTFRRMFSYPAAGKYRNQNHRRHNQTEVAARNANSVVGRRCCRRVNEVVSSTAITATAAANIEVLTNPPQVSRPSIKTTDNLRRIAEVREKEMYSASLEDASGSTSHNMHSCFIFLTLLTI